MAEVKFYNSVWRTFLLLIVCLLFVAGGFFTLYHGKNIYMSWFCIGFFSLGVPVFSHMLIFRKPQIILNSKGFTHIHHKAGLIQWDYITDAYLVDVNRNTYLCLSIKDEVNPSLHFNAIEKELSGVVKDLFGVSECSFFISNLNIKPKLLNELVLELIHAGEEKNRYGILILAATRLKIN